VNAHVRVQMAHRKPSRQQAQQATPQPLPTPSRYRLPSAMPFPQPMLRPLQYNSAAPTPATIMLQQHTYLL